MDLRNGFMAIVYRGPDGDYFKSGYTAHFEKFEDWFKKNGTNFLCSNDKPFTSDFHLWEMID
jgi:hypothetical protein